MAARLEDMLEGVLKIQERQLSSDELVRARLVKSENLVMQLASQFENHDTK